MQILKRHFSRNQISLTVAFYNSLAAVKKPFIQHKMAFIKIFVPKIK